MSRSTAKLNNQSAAIDLAQVAQRILKLAEISVLDHLEALERSQAVGLSQNTYGTDEDNGNAERCR